MMTTTRRLGIPTVEWVRPVQPFHHVEFVSPTAEAMGHPAAYPPPSPGGAGGGSDAGVHPSVSPLRRQMVRASGAALLLTTFCLLLVAGCESGKLGLSLDRSNASRIKPGRGYNVGDRVQPVVLPFDPANPPPYMFVSPTADAPYWWLAWRLPDWTDGPGAAVSSVTVNGRPVNDYAVMVSGQMHETPWITRDRSTATRIVLIVKMLWADGASYDLAAQATSGGGNRTMHTASLQAPSIGGGPAGFRCYDSFKLTETAGVDRRAEPVEVVVAAERSESHGLAHELRLYEYRVDSRELVPMPFQVFDSRTFQGMPPVPEGREPKGNHPLNKPSQSVRVAFLADVPANASRIYCAAYGGGSNDPVPPSPHRLQATPAGGGASVVENAHYRVRLHAQNGQIESVSLKTASGTQAFTNSATGCVHANPDVYGDSGHWGRTTAWNPPERTHVAASGPLLYRVTRAGRMPNNPQVQVSVTYSFWAGVPYVLVSSTMNVTNDFATIALCNGEMAFDAELFDAYAWQTPGGQLRQVRALNRADPLIDGATMLPPNVPWLALYHSQQQRAFGAISLTAAALDPQTGNPSVYRPAYFLYGNSFGKFPRVHVTRAWVYPWGYNDHAPAIPVYAGSTYVAQMALVPFTLDEKTPFAPIENLSRTLRTPLEVAYGH